MVSKILVFKSTRMKSFSGPVIIEYINIIVTSKNPREEVCMVIANEEVQELIAEIPEGHKHLRTTIKLQDGRTFTFQEATIANLVRAYITVKTHPKRTKVRLLGRKLSVRKEGYAEWQLAED